MYIHTGIYICIFVSACAHACVRVRACVRRGEGGGERERERGPGGEKHDEEGIEDRNDGLRESSHDLPQGMQAAEEAQHAESAENAKRLDA
jgi:hypothetical protein